MTAGSRKGLKSDISIIEAMDHPALFQQFFPGDSWDNWRTILKARLRVAAVGRRAGVFA